MTVEKKEEENEQIQSNFETNKDLAIEIYKRADLCEKWNEDSEEFVFAYCTVIMAMYMDARANFIDYAERFKSEYDKIVTKKDFIKIMDKHLHNTPPIKMSEAIDAFNIMTMLAKKIPEMNKFIVEERKKY